jgi:hypothetical protein
MPALPQSKHSSMREISSCCRLLDNEADMEPVSGFEIELVFVA